MKNPLTSICGAIVAAAVVLLSCSQPASDAPAKFEANSAIIAQVFADFEAESDDFFTHFNAEAVWRGTGLNAPDSVTLEQVTAKYKAAWSKYDYELVSPTNFLPGVNPQTKAVDGSVRGYRKCLCWNHQGRTDNANRQDIHILRLRELRRHHGKSPSKMS